MSHKAKALVSTCMDLRFQKVIHNWLEENNLYELGHDRVAFAGAGGDLEILLSQVRLSAKLHDIDEVHILNHQNCGYYGPSLESGSTEEREKHTTDLQTAKDAITKEFPNVKVFGYFLTIDQKVDKIF